MNLPHQNGLTESRRAVGPINGLPTVVAMLSLMALSVAAESPTDGSWTDAVKALGLSLDSNDYRNIVRRYGDATRSQSEQREIVKFKIASSGELPNGVIAARSSPEDAIRVLGLPLSETRNGGGYRKLRYSVGDFLMTLYYGPQLDFVTFTKK
jgi:hypothetical protein